MIIGVDCDLTVVDPIPQWIEWLVTLTGYRPFLPSEGREYDITTYWPREIQAYYRNQMFDYWRQKDVYIGMEPLAGAVEVLSYLHNKGHTIRFVTHIKGNHYFSKVSFLKTYFPFLDGIIATKEKWCLAADCLIDDRIKYLTSVPFPHKILFPSIYTQDAEITPDIIVATGWGHIKQIIEEINDEVPSR